MAGQTSTTRQGCLDIAAHALLQAVVHAERAGSTAYSIDRCGEAQAHAAAGALWADVTRSATALAALLPTEEAAWEPEAELAAVTGRTSIPLDAV